jgi:hypothetical protein
MVSLRTAIGMRDFTPDAVGITLDGRGFHSGRHGFHL